MHLFVKQSSCWSCKRGESSMFWRLICIFVFLASLLGVPTPVTGCSPSLQKTWRQPKALRRNLKYRTNEGGPIPAPGKHSAFENGTPQRKETRTAGALPKHMRMRLAWPGSPIKRFKAHRLADMMPSPGSISMVYPNTYLCSTRYRWRYWPQPLCSMGEPGHTGLADRSGGGHRHHGSRTD